MLDPIVKRLAQVGLELNLDKTRIVYCKDANRTGFHEHERFLGFPRFGGHVAIRQPFFPLK